MAGKRIFITALEREKRIEVLMRRKKMNWHQLSLAMGRDQSSTMRVLKAKRDGSKQPDPRISTIKSVAKALGVSAGFMLDREVKR